VAVPEHPPALREFIDRVTAIVDAGGTERELTAAVAEAMRPLLDSGPFVPEPLTEPHPERYVMYPLHVAEDASFSIASAVWGVGQGTPVHDHRTWGVIGIYSGAEQEDRYLPAEPAPRYVSTKLLQKGDIEVCCVADDDIHAVRCASDVPCVGIHVYGANIGQLPRRAYDVETGRTTTFVSAWSEPVHPRAPDPRGTAVAHRVLSPTCATARPPTEDRAGSATH
jgi:predicted metal-dependent enzyme (double-stranded beta helix superfamily)